MKVSELIKLLKGLDPDFEVMLVELKCSEDGDIEHYYEDFNEVEINLLLKTIGIVVNPTYEAEEEVQE
jgi:hypothetical protein